MKTKYMDFIRKKLSTASDEFLDKYNKFRLLPFQLKASECQEVYDFIEECKKEYGALA